MYRTIILVAALLTGCAAPSGDLAYSRATPSQPSIQSSFATQFAGPATFLAPLPTAVILLKPGDLNRNRAFCAAAAQLPTAREALSATVVAPNLILTRWLVQLSQIPRDRVSDCEFLVGTYDYARARNIMGSLRLAEGSFAGPGPFLLLAIPDNTGLHVAGIDGSAYDQADFPRFIATWSTALHQAETQLSRAPDEPGLVRSLLDVLTAILRTASNVTGGLLRGIALSL